MARLPIVGQDKEWGTILNEFLAVEHEPDGALKANAAIARVDPGTDGATRRYIGHDGTDPVWRDEAFFNVKHFGATGVPGQNQTAAIQAAIDAAEALTSGSTTRSATIYFPPGIYDVTGLTIDKQGITLLGAGRWATWVRGTEAGVNMVTLTSADNLRVDSMRFHALSTAGHIFAIANSLSHALFYNVWCYQQNPAKSILWGDDTVTGTELNYIDNLWLHCETEHVETATVASFHLRGGAVNRNRWLSMRHTYTGNYAFLFETTAVSSYANDNTIDGVNFEVCTGGVVKALGAQGLVLRDIAVYDLFNTTTRDLIYLGNSTVTPTLSARSVTMDNVRRNGFTLGGGLYDINVQTSSATPRVAIRNSGGSTSLAVNANLRLMIVEESNVTLTNGDNVTRIDAGAGGSTFANPVTLKGTLKLASYTTAGRPAATTAGAGATIWNTSTNMPNYSDGTNWRDAAGTVV